jgi:uncharacterized protein YjiS (DUF1127 family)
MRLLISCNAAIYCATQHKIPYIAFLKPAKAGERTTMISSLIRLLQSWKDYGTAVRELSGLNDRELADLGISRSDIAWVAWQHARD